MILLGAGASKIFGIKTLQDMSIDLIQKMREKGYSDLIDKILIKLQLFDLTPDFESIYAILEGLTKRARFWSNNYLSFHNSLFFNTHN